MKFELTNYRGQKKYSDEELLSDLRKVAATNGGRVSKGIYSENGEFGTDIFLKRFGSWNKALIAARISRSRSGAGAMVSDDDLLEDIRIAASTLGAKITFEQYATVGKFSKSPFNRRFGGWGKALIAAGLEANQARYLTEDELFENLEEVWIKLGRQPKYVEMRSPFSKFSGGTYADRYGTWVNAVEKFVDVANREPSEGELYSSSEDKSNLDSEAAENTQLVNELPTQVELNSFTENMESTSDSEVVANRKGDIYDDAKSLKVKAKILTQVEERFKHKTKREINWRMRWKVISRDYYKCVACGRAPAKDPSVELHVDHIKPWSKGGETVLENLQTLCATCNLGKSNIE